MKSNKAIPPGSETIERPNLSYILGYKSIHFTNGMKAYINDQ